MRKVVYRSILGNNPRKREVSIEEISNKPKNRVARKWICKYFLNEKHSSERLKDLENWIQTKKNAGNHKRCHILRRFDARTGENKIVCKVLGDLFVVFGNTAYKILYINELRIQVDTAGKMKKGA
ncbi:MAG: hypothetical protein DRP85_00520 [Candidatus Makaraimicrobium thalassicum]|nr:MAG: hypothetical protein DRP85_00520 [Candidatus Omnitrophota bacterium]